VNETLLLLEDLNQALSQTGGSDRWEKWWDLLVLIESSLERDPRCSDVDRNNMERLRAGIGDVIDAQMECKDVVFSLATMPLKALESSIRQRAARHGGGTQV
jgi:hypothetical protein